MIKSHKFLNIFHFKSLLKRCSEDSSDGNLESSWRKVRNVCTKEQSSKFPSSVLLFQSIDRWPKLFAIRNAWARTWLPDFQPAGSRLAVESPRDCFLSVNGLVLLLLLSAGKVAEINFLIHKWRALTTSEVPIAPSINNAINRLNREYRTHLFISQL